MKRTLILLLIAVMTLSLCACSSSSEGKKKMMYVLGPTPDVCWTAQAGTYASEMCEQINAEGKYKATYIPASSGEEQVDQVNTVVANGNASVVVMMALDDSALAGQETLYAEGIPFISFDRIIEATEKYALLNYSGNNWQVGAGIAYRMQQNGLHPGDTAVVFYGDNGTVCSRRQEGFEQFLRGEIAYSDAKLGEFTTTEVWTQEELDAFFNTYNVVCNYTADLAYEYMEQKADEFVAAAKANNGKLYMYAMDENMTLGIINYLSAGASEQTKQSLQDMEVYTSAVGGMQEVYDIMSGKDAERAAILDTYIDDIVHMYFSPTMMKSAVQLGLDYLDGNWDYEQGSCSYEPVFMVDRATAGSIEGFTGK